jgi:hypothetical protein
MSEHDPFDGIYDDVPAGPGDSGEQQPLVGAPQERPANVDAQDEQAVEESAPPATEVAHPETHSRTQLARMRRAELQAAARERGLSTSGDRDDLIERVWAAQQESA